MTYLEPFPTIGLTEADVDILMNNVRNVMLEEYEKLSKEVIENSKDPKWAERSRPRLTVI